MIYISSQLFSYNGYKLNSHLTCFQRGFVAQLVEHRTGIAEVMGSNPVGHEAPGFFLGFLCNCFSCFIYNCEDHFHLHSLPTVHYNDLYHIHVISSCILILLTISQNSKEYVLRLKIHSRASENGVTDIKRNMSQIHKHAQ